MFRIDNNSAIPTLPNPEPPGTPGFFTGGNIAAGQLATILDAPWANSIQEEIITVIQAAGITLDKSSHTQLFEALQALYTVTGQTEAFLPLTGGQLYRAGPTGADPLRIQADTGLSARINYQVLGLHQWRVGADPSGRFSFTDVTSGRTQPDFLIEPSVGAAAFANNLEVHGGIFYGRIGGTIGTADWIMAHNPLTSPPSLEIGWNSGGYPQMQPVFLRLDRGTGTDVNFTLLSDGAFKTTAGPWSGISDARVKKNVEDYDRGLDAVCSLRPVTYQMNGLERTDDDGATHIGLLAQEAREVMPEMFFERPGELGGDPEPVYYMDVGPLTYALVNSVRTLAARVEALEAKGA